MQLEIKNEEQRLVVNEITKRIKNTKWEDKVYLDGEYVRNTILGIQTNTLSIVVEAPKAYAEFSEWLCKELNCYINQENPAISNNLGMSFFTLDTLSKGNDVLIQCTQTQSGLEKVDNAMAEHTIYSTLHGDALDKDATIDTVYAKLSNLELFNPSAKKWGMVDLFERKVISLNGLTSYAIKEDPTRILRLAYLSAVTNWGIDTKTWLLMVENAHLLLNTPQQAITNCLNKILALPTPSVALRILRHCGALHVILPHIANMIGCEQGPAHFGDVFDHTMRVVDTVRNTPVLRWAALLHDVAKPFTRVVENGKIKFPNHDSVGCYFVKSVLPSMKFQETTVDQIGRIIHQHMAFKKNGNVLPSNKQIKKFISAVGVANLTLALELMHADNMAHAEGHQRKELVPYVMGVIRKMQNDVKEANANKALPVNGSDIITWFKIKAGPEVGKLLSVAREIYSKQPTLTKNKLLLEIQKEVSA